MVYNQSAMSDFTNFIEDVELMDLSLCPEVYSAGLAIEWILLFVDWIIF